MSFYQGITRIKENFTIGICNLSNPVREYVQNNHPFSIFKNFAQKSSLCNCNLEVKKCPSIMTITASSTAKDINKFTFGITRYVRILISFSFFEILSFFSSFRGSLTGTAHLARRPLELFHHVL